MIPDAAPPTIAIVSGKGGSGKTMVAAVAATALARSEQEVVLIDADTATAGLSYYFGLRMVHNIRGGLSTIAGSDRMGTSIMDLTSPTPIQRVKLDPDNPERPHQMHFLPVGDHRRIQRDLDPDDRASLLRDTVSWFRDLGMWTIIDCRGGIDEESLAVCEVVDDILLVVEPDTTSFQATQHLVDVLSDRKLDHKLHGFLINKVFDDPSVVARNGTSVFGAQFLGAVPFDLEATRSFLVGKVPASTSLFTIHVVAALSRGYPYVPLRPAGAPWRNEDFRDVGLTSLDSYRGGVLTASGILALTVVATYFALTHSLRRSTELLITGLLGLMGLLGSVEGSRRSLGRIFVLLSRKLSQRKS